MFYFLIHVFISNTIPFARYLKIQFLYLIFARKHLSVFRKNRFDGNAELFYRKFNWSRARCEVLITVNMLNAIFWGLTPCSLEEVYRRFEGTYSLQLQFRRENQALN